MGNNKFEILWTEVAESDLSEIIEFIAQDSTNMALKILAKIKVKTSQLNHSPERGRVVPEFKKFNINSIRELIESPWRIFYKLEGSIVYILCVIDSRRNVEDILLNRFLRGK
ncbi:MAG: type II toxin-antitoxin system RelE/ParE family toxin [Fibrobacteria bacterium]|nr:type II toxin-antitoxin system RelE/ParE family toxin [Fibrobacteria bacterium]